MNHFITNTYLLLLGYAKAYFHLPYKQTKEGITQGQVKGKVSSIPNYTTINRRIIVGYKDKRY
ncbi:MAG TPA: hypothetical protein VIY08_12065 [Candidatus Nitrosocosmicus sp.]